MNLEILKDKFKEYVDTFDIKDKGISRKYYHSLRVMDLAILLAKHHKFSLEDTEICAITGLLHDYARFEQWTKYKTYSDLKSIDHGDLGVKLLFENNDIKKFANNEEYYDEIKDAIKYHNKYKIESNQMSVHNRKICEIIRDADKLDIFYILTNDKELIDEDTEYPTIEIAKDFYKNESIDVHKVKNKADNILLKLSMVYDLYYDYSYIYLKDNKLIEKIYNNIENKEMYKDYFDYIIEYIDRKCKNVR